MPPVAVVMNMFYTGLGIARSLGERGVPVIGLTAHRGTYGNFTRWAKVQSCPDSREQPEALLEFLLRLGRGLAEKGVLFPTRDDDVTFLDRFRDQLREYFVLAVPERHALEASLDKWDTYRWAQEAGVPAPQCWLVTGKSDLVGVLSGLTFPCVMKPVAAHHWRKAGNWKIVGGRKAIAVSSQEELLAEYEVISRADSRVLIQEIVPGPDNNLRIAACYMDRSSRFVAGFTAEKVLQVPEGFGTGCIVQTVSRPELLDAAARLLESIQFSGIAEVEFKWDASCNLHKLIEINPRPWDQHRLGKACRVDLIYFAYCDYAGLERPPVTKPSGRHKWIAEDVFLWTFFQSLWRGDRNLGSLVRLARGRRTYAIWSIRDPLPFLILLAGRLLPDVLKGIPRYLRYLITRSMGGERKVHPTGFAS